MTQDMSKAKTRIPATEGTLWRGSDGREMRVRYSYDLASGVPTVTLRAFGAGDEQLVMPVEALLERMTCVGYACSQMPGSAVRTGDIWLVGPFPGEEMRVYKILEPVAGGFEVAVVLASHEEQIRCGVLSHTTIATWFEGKIPHFAHRVNHAPAFAPARQIWRRIENGELCFLPVGVRQDHEALDAWCPVGVVTAAGNAFVGDVF